MGLVAAVLVVLAFLLFGGISNWLMLTVLCALSVLSWPARGKGLAGKTTLSFASILYLASVALVGPLGAALVGAVSPLAGLRQQQPQQRVFNVAMNMIIAGFAGFVYIWVGGEQVNTDMGPSDLILRVGLPLIPADLAMCLANALLMSGVMRLSRGIPVRRFVATMLTSSGPAYVGYGLIGFLFAVLWVPAGVGPFSALLVLSPLFVARWAFVQYGEENNAHDRTLRALVAAVETKDIRTRGHSERVASLCDLIAAGLGLSHTETASLRYAGMLHDVGILAVPGRVLRKTDTLSDSDLASIRLHPASGAEMVEEIEFLKPALDGIRFHHERYDGRGYPLGQTGEKIPQFARIVAVADAFESLTADNADRDALKVDDALDELERRAGTQFDPVVVAALRRGLVRQQWDSRPRDIKGAAALARGYDHDDPSQSDAMADRSWPQPTTAGSSWSGQHA